MVSSVWKRRLIDDEQASQALIKKEQHCAEPMAGVLVYGFLLARYARCRNATPTCSIAMSLMYDLFGDRFTQSSHLHVNICLHACELHKLSTPNASFDFLHFSYLTN